MSKPYTIVCTIGMITDIVRNVAGEHAQVEGIIGEGVDPHLYNPTRGDVVKLSKADVVFYNGLLLEGKMTDVLVRVASSGKPVKAVTELVLEDADYLLEKDDNSTPWQLLIPITVQTTFPMRNSTLKSSKHLMRMQSSQLLRYRSRNGFL